MLTTRIGMLIFWIKKRGTSERMVHPLSAKTPLLFLAFQGAVTFDDFCELLDFEDMPDEILQKCDTVVRWLSVFGCRISEEGYWNLKCFWRFIQPAFSADTFCTDTWGLSIGDAFLFLHLSTRNYERHQSVCWKITTNSLLLVLAQHSKYFKLLELHYFKWNLAMLPAWCVPGTTRKTEGFCRKVVCSLAGFQNPKNLPQDRELFSRSDQCTNVKR